MGGMPVIIAIASLEIVLYPLEICSRSMDRMETSFTCAYLERCPPRNPSPLCYDFFYCCRVPDF